jgi:hypothetical protein
MKRYLFWALAGATFAVYATMIAWSLPTITAQAGGLMPFDLRPGGYNYDEAVQFLTALSADGVQFYRDVQHRLDMAFPALIALTLFFALWSLLPRRLGIWGALAASPALAIAVFDYLENQGVARMLTAGPEAVTPSMVAEASTWTLLKSTVTTVVMTAVLLLLLWRAGRALHARLKANAAP